jgi:hypothetical protein
MTTLATLGVLTSDDGIVEAVIAEIDELGIDKPDPRGELSYLLSLIKLAKVSSDGTSIIWITLTDLLFDLRTTGRAPRRCWLVQYTLTLPTYKAGYGSQE